MANNNSENTTTGQTDPLIDNNLIPPYQTHGSGYPDITDLVRQINETHFDPNTGETIGKAEAIPHNNHYAYVGGLIPDENKEYIATCTKSAQDDSSATVWIDSDAVLAHEAKALILQKCGHGKPVEEFTDDEKLAVIAMRDDLHNTLQNSKLNLLGKLRLGKVSTREDAWIDWLANNGGGDRKTLKELARNRRTELSKLPEQMEALGNRPRQTQIEEVKNLFMPDKDMSAEEKQLLSALEKHYERQLCEGHFQRCSDLIRGLAVYRRGGLYIDVDFLPAFNDRLLDAVKAVGMKELDIEQHIFKHHADWINPKKKPVPINADEEQGQRLESIFQDIGIRGSRDAFKSIGEIYIYKDLFSIRHIGNNNLSMGAFAGHARSKGLLIALTRQAYNLDYAELANTKHKEINAGNRGPISIADDIDARKQLMPPTLPPRFVDAIAKYRYDSLVAGALSSSLMTGRGVMMRSMRTILRDLNAPMETLHPFFTRPLDGKFCVETILGLKSSWRLFSNKQREAIGGSPSSDPHQHSAFGIEPLTSHSKATVDEIGTVSFIDYDTNQAKPRPVLPYKNGHFRWPLKIGPTSASRNIEQFLATNYDSKKKPRPQLKKLTAQGEGSLNTNAVFKNNEIAAFELPDPKGKVNDGFLLIVSKDELNNGRVMMISDKNHVTFNELDHQITADKSHSITLRIRNVIERKSKLGFKKGRK